MLATIQQVIVENGLHRFQQVCQFLRRHVVDKLAGVDLVEPHILAVVVAKEMPVMAVHLTLSPGQALVKQSFQRALDAEIPLLDIPEHRGYLLCRSGRVNLAARNYRQAHLCRLFECRRPVDHLLSPYRPG